MEGWREDIPADGLATSKYLSAKALRFLTNIMYLLQSYYGGHRVWSRAVRSRTPLICIVGETASGKSALALDIAERYNGEIICADSWTVRREVTIGTAKPTQQEQARVPHHLLDIAGPDEDFTAAVFKDRAVQAITDITQRGKLPIMVGGTGLYIDGVLYDYSFLPAGDRGDRRHLSALSNDELIASIIAKSIPLGNVDVRNKRRLIRLLETGGAQPVKKNLRADTLVLGIRTEREVLHARIAHRVDGMLAAGLEAEVRDLVARYGWECEALKGVGYAQWRGYFEHQDDYAQTRLKIIKATQDLAKRQRTWFKRNQAITWISTPVNMTEVDELITTFLSSKLAD
jgi:tRNA dimethylallyltransferase